MTEANNNVLPPAPQPPEMSIYQAAARLNCSEQKLFAIRHSELKAGRTDPFRSELRDGQLFLPTDVVERLEAADWCRRYHKWRNQADIIRRIDSEAAAKGQEPATSAATNATSKLYSLRRLKIEADIAKVKLSMESTRSKIGALKERRGELSSNLMAVQARGHVLEAELNGINSELQGHYAEDIRHGLDLDELRQKLAGLQNVPHPEPVTKPAAAAKPNRRRKRTANMPKASPLGLLNAKQCAQGLGMSYGGFMQAVKAGRFPKPVKTGHTHMWAKKDFRHLTQGGTQ